MIQTIYTLWLREMKRFLRIKMRLVTTITTPLMFLAFFALGFADMRFPGVGDVGYLQFLVPGIIGMGLIFSSTFAGMSVLVDKEFGFLKEVMIAPVSRTAIVLGRIAGGLSMGLIQAVLILLISTVIGFSIPGVLAFLLALIFMTLVSVVFIGFGLIVASKMRDMHSFPIVVNFFIFPLFFLSGAVFPISGMPGWVKWLSLIDPLTFGVDGMRRALAGVSEFSYLINAVVLLVWAVATVTLGAWFFERSDAY